MKPPFQLVPDDVPHDVRGAVVRLHSDIDSKRRLVGLAYIGMYAGDRTVIANAAGEFYRSPDVARGYLAQLHDALGRLSRGEQLPPGW